MRRRTAIQWMLAVAGSLPLGIVGGGGPTAGFPGQQAADAIAGKFVEWVRNYRPGADLEHGYGHPQIRGKKASPAPAYLAQLESLEHTASLSLAAAASRPTPGGG